MANPVRFGMIDICMIKYPEVRILHLPEESNAGAVSIQPNGSHNLLYDPYVIHQRGLTVVGFIRQLDDQNSRADRIETIDDELGQLIAQTRLADLQTDTIAALEQVADTIPCEGIGEDLCNLATQKAELAARLEDINRREQAASADIINVLHQIDAVLGFRDELARQLTDRRLDECNWRFGRERSEVEPELEQVIKDEAVVAALYKVLSVPWPTGRIRRPEKELPVVQQKPTAMPSSPRPGKRAAIGDRTIQFAVSEELQESRVWSHPADASIRQLSWVSQPYAGTEQSEEPDAYNPCDEWLDKLNNDAPPRTEPKYDPEFDLVLHELNGTAPPKTAEEIVTDNIKVLIDRLRDPAASLEDLTSEYEGRLTQTERIAAFLIARAGQTLTGLDIGRFLYAKQGKELDVAFAVNKARTLMGPQSHGQKVLKAMSPFGYAIQYGSKEIKGVGRARTMRLYRGLSVAETVLPEDTDSAISWEPFAPK